MKYDIIMFDADDTLFDFSISQKNALHNTFTQFDLPTGLVDYEADYKEISSVLWRELEQGFITTLELGVERFRRLFLQHELAFDAQRFSDDYLINLGKESHLIEGAEQLCTQLAGCRLVIITNGFTAVQQSRIANSPLCNTFEYIITSEEAGYQKPNERIFDYVFSKLQITNKSSVLIVGDSLTSDIQGGFNYGIDTCWYNPNGKENNLAIKPTHEIRELMELVEIVEG
ncbi:YjjG family noncanonical pyrimidine nucleotidase [Paenibacillus endoradicis]|uniref:YjjG family noncanonical pyrimidine nucleotidase n=1 Tax=Paenibacillus endoradicis TaxID=2972487 RepID=UPI0021590B1D|nr:YjjG family noncanonical pyrimidine nucleotidase [Paenibacillus endoradicis]MCR8657697.1 YjjG family noncanonical pyrimidine nucleotidase [Paenibacillus endoradicis]